MSMASTPSALVAASSAGNVVAVRDRLSTRPRLRRVRMNMMGSVHTAKPGVVPEDSTVQPSKDSSSQVSLDTFASEAAEALAAATVAGHCTVVQLLLDRNADPNVPCTEEGWTAYHLACAHDQADCLEALVRAGCDEPRLDASGRTGAQLAEERHCQRVLQRLAGPLAVLRMERLGAKNERRRIERGKRALLASAVQYASGHGLYLEFGVASGRSINFIASRVPTGPDGQKILVHGFDSFEGLPQDWREGRESGFFDRGGKLPAVAPNVRLYPGWFDDTLPAFLRLPSASAGGTTAAEEVLSASSTVGCAPSATGEELPTVHEEVAAASVAFLHIDCDIYSSTRTVLRHLAPRLRVGSVIVFDEWCGYDGWEEHEAKAWAETCAENHIDFEWIDSPSHRQTGKAARRPLEDDVSGPSRALAITAIRRGASQSAAVPPLPVGLPPSAAPSRATGASACAAGSAGADAPAGTGGVLREGEAGGALGQLGGGGGSLAASLLDMHSLGCARPPDATHTGGPATRPFACAVRIAIDGLTPLQAIEQGTAIVDEVRASLSRGPAATNRQLRPGAAHYVLWEDLGPHSLRVEPNKSNNVNWLTKAWSTKVDPAVAWPPQRELLQRVLPHAHAWTAIIERARADEGIDIKDDCRLEDCSARCHQVHARLRCAPLRACARRGTTPALHTGAPPPPSPMQRPRTPRTCTRPRRTVTTAS